MMQNCPVLSKQTSEAGIEQVAMQAAALDARAIPNLILVAPWGHVESAAGHFLVDDLAAQSTLSAFKAHGADLPVDYEHQTLGGPYSAPDGLAPAAGWIKDLLAVSPEQAGQGERPPAPGIWALVEWTREALTRLAGRQYRYVSPVALVRKSDRRLVGLHSVALTNKPAIVGMRDVLSGPEPRGGARPEPIDELRDLLGVDESATEDIVLVAAKQRIDDLLRAEAARLAEQRVGRALASGKLAPSQRGWALALALKDPAEFDRWETSAPPVVAMGRLAASSGGERPPSHRAVETAASAEWLAHREFLEKLCTREAYVAAALREAASA